MTPSSRKACKFRLPKTIYPDIPLKLNITQASRVGFRVWLHHKQVRTCFLTTLFQFLNLVAQKAFARLRRNFSRIPRMTSLTASEPTKIRSSRTAVAVTKSSAISRSSQPHACWHQPEIQRPTIMFAVRYSLPLTNQTYYEMWLTPSNLYH